MKNPFSLTFFLSFFLTSVFSQTYDKPFVESVGDRICFITKVELTKQYTIVSFEHLNNNAWIRLEQNIHIKTPNNKRYNYIKAEGITISPEKYEFKEDEKKHTFTVYFQPLPKNTRMFDIIEVEPGSQFDFNFYGVNLDKKRTSDEQIPHFTEESIVTTEKIFTPPPPAEFMQNFENIYKDIYKYSIDAYMNYLKQPNKLKEVAQLSKAYYDALMGEGFTREQALQILISTPVIPNTTGIK